MTTWADIDAAGVQYERRDPNRVACDEGKPTYNATPQDWRTNGDLERLSEYIAARADRPPDKDSRAAARAMLNQVAGDLDGLLEAYREKEKDIGGGESFFVRIARQNPPFWQVPQVMHTYKQRQARSNGTLKARRWYDGFEELVNK